MARTSDELVEEMAVAFFPDWAAGATREKILAPFRDTNLVELAETALCRAQDRFLLQRHERLYGPLPDTLPVGA